jgi:hypothetical protein
MKLVTNANCYDEEKLIFQSDGHLTTHILTLQTKQFTKRLWQWLIYCAVITLVTVHCVRCIDIHNVLRVGPGPIFMWLDVIVKN